MSSSACLKWPFGWCTDPGKYGEPNHLPLRECHHAVAHWQDLCSDFLFLPEWLCFWSSRKSCLQTSSGCLWEWEPTTLWMSGSLMTKAKKTKVIFKVKVVPLITFLRVQTDRGERGEREGKREQTRLPYKRIPNNTIYTKYGKYKIWTRVAAFILITIIYIKIL